MIPRNVQPIVRELWNSFVGEMKGHVVTASPIFRSASYAFQDPVNR